ncbi:CBS-domain-containing protein [Butyriboletus roseoflavus]|nr:CBS-domain-containing protein [Butyriboletus roseoflavus]
MSRIPVPTHHRSIDPMSPSNLSVAPSLPETRKKQSKRDEVRLSSLSLPSYLPPQAIRKKIESELARKRTISTTLQSGRSKRQAKPAVTKGTVAALKPSPALTVPENITVAEASQLCAAKRTDCVLVVDDDEGLSGIFTAKDLAYRVTAEGLDPHSTPVSHIMTRNPMVTRDTTSATEALQLMVQRHFRHLPVCNEDGNVVGLLDITKVFHEALNKVERSSSASEKLYNALAGVQSELGPGMASNPQAAAMLAYVDALREKTALPDLTTVMDSRTQPATVTPKTTVREVAKLMKERRVTAVCVMENTSDSVHPKIAGIFTSKDIVLRVIAAGLDAGICSVIRVMTPHPDTAPPTMTVHDALKKMHNGHYLNLPVVEADGRLVAIVDVLKLTYATLEQMNAMSVEAAGENADTEGGPMWGRFFDSIGGHDDTESMVSGSHVPTDGHSISVHHLSRTQQSPYPEVHPNDSASVVDDDPESVLDAYPRKKGAHNIPSIMGAASTVPLDDGTYVFNVEMLREIVSGKLGSDPFFASYNGDPDQKPDPTDFILSYTDADGDTVLITSDNDIADAVKIARTAGSDRVVLFIQGGTHWEEAGADKSDTKAPEVTTPPQEEVRVAEKPEVGPELPVVAPPPQVPVPPQQELVLGIPKDLLLPASIGALAVVILTVFTVSRLTRD